MNDYVFSVVGDVIGQYEMYEFNYI